MIEHLVVDIGGVLVHPSGLSPVFAQLKHAHNITDTIITSFQQQYGKPLDRGEITFSQYVDKMNEQFGTHYTPRAVLEMKFDNQQMNKVLIDFCKQNTSQFTTSILSDNYEANLRYYETYMRLSEWTYAHIYSHHYGVTKPHPVLYTELLKTLHTQPDRCLFIDDTTENAVKAKEMGMHSITYSSNAQLFKELRRYIAASCF